MEVPWISMLAPILIRLFNLAKEDFCPTFHLAYVQSTSSLPLIETMDYLNLKVVLDSITSNSAALF